MNNYSQTLDETFKIFAKAKIEIIAGLRTDDAHHKQYYLEKALRTLSSDTVVDEAIKDGLFEPGIAP